jgi:hypothetical protein
MDARLPILRAKCFPLKLDRISEEDIVRWMRELINKKLVLLYEVDNKQYLKMITWEKHEQVRNQKSKYPQPIDINCNQLQSIDINCPRNPIQSESNPNPNPNPNTIPASHDAGAYDESTAAVDNTSAEKPDEGGAQDLKVTGSGEYTAEFEEFWSHYPRKVEKRTAFTAWKARIKGGLKAADMIKACINYSNFCNQQNAEQQFIKHASTFLNKDRPFEEFINGIPESLSNKKPAGFKTPVTVFGSYDQRERTPEEIKDLERRLLGRDALEDGG